MIRGFSDHAANERMFLAWVRTGIAAMAFGFVIEKFNGFLLAMAGANPPDMGRRMQLDWLSVCSVGSHTRVPPGIGIIAA